MLRERVFVRRTEGDHALAPAPALAPIHRLPPCSFLGFDWSKHSSLTGKARFPRCLGMAPVRARSRRAKHAAGVRRRRPPGYRAALPAFSALILRSSATPGTNTQRRPRPDRSQTTGQERGETVGWRPLAALPVQASSDVSTAADVSTRSRLDSTARHDWQYMLPPSVRDVSVTPATTSSEPYSRLTPLDTSS